MTNTGTVKGDEVDQLYVHDLAASVTQPVRVLRGFQRVSLMVGGDPAKLATVKLEVTK